MQVQDDIRITIRVNKALKERADALFDRLGMNMTTALNVFLRKAVDEEAIPFPVSVKSTGFGVGSTSDDITGAFKSAVRRDIEEAKRNGFPVARYDEIGGRAYLEMPNGSRDYING